MATPLREMCKDKHRKILDIVEEFAVETVRVPSPSLVTGRGKRTANLERGIKPVEIVRPVRI